MKRLMYVLLFVLLTGVSYAQQAKYVFYFIGDGMGVNQVNGTEMYLAEQEGRIGVKPLLLRPSRLVPWLRLFPPLIP